MTNAKKEVIAYAKLLEKVQSILACFPAECRNIHIDGIQVYRERTDGANWHITNWRRSGDDNDLPVCREKMIAEIRHLRTCYDVEEKK